MANADKEFWMVGQIRRSLVVVLQTGTFLVEQTTQNLISQRSFTLALATNSLIERFYKITSMGHTYALPKIS